MCNCKNLEERLIALEEKVNGVHEVTVPVEIEEGTTLPVYARKGDAGMDIIASEDVYIPHGTRKIVKTGIKIAVPDGFEVQVRPRSGISAKTSLIIPNTPGTIDSGYRGVVGVILYNNSAEPTKQVQNIKNETIPVDSITGVHLREFKGGYLIKKGDRIAQIVLNKVCTIVWEPVEDITTIASERGANGFGSSGVTSK